MADTPQYIMNHVQSNRWVKPVISNEWASHNDTSFSCSATSTCKHTNYCFRGDCPTVIRPFYVLAEDGSVYLTTPDGVIYYLPTDSPTMKMIYPTHAMVSVTEDAPPIDSTGVTNVTGGSGAIKIDLNTDDAEYEPLVRPSYSRVIPWRPGTTNCLVSVGTDYYTVDSVVFSARGEYGRNSTPKGNGGNIKGGLTQPFSNGYYCVQVDNDKCVVFYKDTLIYEGHYSGMGVPTPFAYAHSVCSVGKCCPTRDTKITWDYDVYPKWKLNPEGRYKAVSTLEAFLRDNFKLEQNGLAKTVIKRKLDHKQVFDGYSFIQEYCLKDLSTLKVIDNAFYNFEIYDINQAKLIGYAEVLTTDTDEQPRGYIKSVIRKEDYETLYPDLEDTLIGQRVCWSLLKAEIYCSLLEDEKVYGIEYDCEYAGLFHCTYTETETSCGENERGGAPGRIFWYEGAGFKETGEDASIWVSRWRHEMCATCDPTARSETNPDPCACKFGTEDSKQIFNIYTTDNNCKYSTNDGKTSRICGKCNYPVTFDGEEPVWKHRKDCEKQSEEDVLLYRPTWTCKAKIARVTLAHLGGRIESIYYDDGTESDWAYISTSEGDCRVRKDYTIIGAVEGRYGDDATKTYLPGYYSDDSENSESATKKYQFSDDAANAVILRAPASYAEDTNRDCTVGFPHGDSYIITRIVNRGTPKKVDVDKLRDLVAEDFEGYYLGSPCNNNNVFVVKWQDEGTETAIEIVEEWKTEDGQVVKVLKTHELEKVEKGTFKKETKDANGQTIYVTEDFHKQYSRSKETQQWVFDDDDTVEQTSIVYEPDWMFSKDGTNPCSTLDPPARFSCSSRSCSEVIPEPYNGSLDFGDDESLGALLYSHNYDDREEMTVTYEDLVWEKSDDPASSARTVVTGVTVVERTEEKTTEEDERIIYSTKIVVTKKLFFDTDSGQDSSNIDITENVEVTRTTTKIKTELSTQPIDVSSGNPIEVPIEKDPREVLTMFMRFYPAYLTYPGYIPPLNEGTEDLDIFDAEWEKKITTPSCPEGFSLPDPTAETCSKPTVTETIGINDTCYCVGELDKNPLQGKDSEWSFVGLELIEEGTSRWGVRWSHSVKQKKDDDDETTPVEEEVSEEEVVIELPRPVGLCSDKTYATLASIKNPVGGMWYCLGVAKDEEYAFENYGGVETGDISEFTDLSGVKWVQACFVWGDPDGIAVRGGTQVGDIYYKLGKVEEEDEQEDEEPYENQDISPEVTFEKLVEGSDRYWYWSGFEWVDGEDYFADIGSEKVIFYKDEGKLDQYVKDYTEEDEVEDPNAPTEEDGEQPKKTIRGSKETEECEHSKAIFIGKVKNKKACGNLLAVNLNSGKEYHAAVFYKAKPVWDRPAYSAETFPDQQEMFRCMGSAYTLLAYNTGKDKQRFCIWYHPFGVETTNPKTTYAEEFDYNDVPDIGYLKDRPVSVADIATYGAEEIAKKYLTALSRDRKTLYVFYEGKRIKTYKYPDDFRENNNKYDGYKRTTSVIQFETTDILDISGFTRDQKNKKLAAAIEAGDVSENDCWKLFLHQYPDLSAYSSGHEASYKTVSGPKYCALWVDSLGSEDGRLQRHNMCRGFDNPSSDSSYDHMKPGIFDIFIEGSLYARKAGIIYFDGALIEVVDEENQGILDRRVELDKRRHKTAVYLRALAQKNGEPVEQYETWKDNILTWCYEGELQELEGDTAYSTYHIEAQYSNWMCHKLLVLGGSDCAKTEFNICGLQDRNRVGYYYVRTIFNKVGYGADRSDESLYLISDAKIDINRRNIYSIGWENVQYDRQPGNMIFIDQYEYTYYTMLYNIKTQQFSIKPIDFKVWHYEPYGGNMYTTECGSSYVSYVNLDELQDYKYITFQYCTELRDFYDGPCVDDDGVDHVVVCHEHYDGHPRDTYSPDPNTEFIIYDDQHHRLQSATVCNSYLCLVDDSGEHTQSEKAYKGMSIDSGSLRKKGDEWYNSDVDPGCTFSFNDHDKPSHLVTSTGHETHISVNFHVRLINHPAELGIYPYSVKDINGNTLYRIYFIDNDAGSTDIGFFVYYPHSHTAIYQVYQGYTLDAAFRYSYAYENIIKDQFEHWKQYGHPDSWIGSVNSSEVDPESGELLQLHCRPSPKWPCQKGGAGISGSSGGKTGMALTQLGQDVYFTIAYPCPKTLPYVDIIENPGQQSARMKYYIKPDGDKDLWIGLSVTPLYNTYSADKDGKACVFSVSSKTCDLSATTIEDIKDAESGGDGVYELGSEAPPFDTLSECEEQLITYKVSPTGIQIIKNAEFYLQHLKNEFVSDTIDYSTDTGSCEVNVQKIVPVYGTQSILCRQKRFKCRSGYWVYEENSPRYPCKTGNRENSGDWIDPNSWTYSFYYGAVATGIELVFSEQQTKRYNLLECCNGPYALIHDTENHKVYGLYKEHILFEESTAGSPGECPQPDESQQQSNEKPMEGIIYSLVSCCSEAGLFKRRHCNSENGKWEEACLFIEGQPVYPFTAKPSDDSSANSDESSDGQSPQPIWQEDVGFAGYTLECCEDGYDYYWLKANKINVLPPDDVHEVFVDEKGDEEDKAYYKTYHDEEDVDYIEYDVMHGSSDVPVETLKLIPSDRNDYDVVIMHIKTRDEVDNPEDLITRALEDGSEAYVLRKGVCSSAYNIKDGDVCKTVTRYYEYPVEWETKEGLRFLDDKDYDFIEHSECDPTSTYEKLIVETRKRYVPWKWYLDVTDCNTYVYYKTDVISTDPRIDKLECFRYRNIYADDKTKRPEYHATAAYTVFHDDPRDAITTWDGEFVISEPSSGCDPCASTTGGDGASGQSKLYYTSYWESPSVQNVLGVRALHKGLDASERILYDSSIVDVQDMEKEPVCDAHTDGGSEKDSGSFCAVKGKIKESQKNMCIMVWSRTRCDTRTRYAKGGNIDDFHDHDRPLKPYWDGKADFGKLEDSSDGKSIKELRDSVLYFNDYNAAGRWDRVSGDDPVDAWTSRDLSFESNELCAGVGGLFTSAPAYHKQKDPDNDPLDRHGRLIVSGNNTLYVFDESWGRRDFNIITGLRLEYVRPSTGNNNG